MYCCYSKIFSLSFYATELKLFLLNVYGLCVNIYKVKIDYFG